MNFQPNYLLIDAARALSGLQVLMDTNSKFECLYKGKMASSLGQVAPYLFECDANGTLFEKFVEYGWGNAWGIPLISNADFIELHHHFRRFLMVQTEDYKQLYFRFYDPRVLRDFLPTCSDAQLKSFFGPVEQFICEEEDPLYNFIYRLEEGKLKTEKVLFENLII